jgi:hypothetical protein
MHHGIPFFKGAERKLDSAMQAEVRTDAGQLPVSD